MRATARPTARLARGSAPKWPSCSRSTAGPINGDEVNTDDVRREAMKVDISALLGGDIYSMLRDRSAKAKSRFSKERDDERASKERQRCLENCDHDGWAGSPARGAGQPAVRRRDSDKAAEAPRRAQQALAPPQATATLEASHQERKAPMSVTYTLARRFLTEVDPRWCGSSSSTSGSKGAARSSATSAASRRESTFRRSFSSRSSTVCQLRCQGCWVDVAASRQMIDATSSTGSSATPRRHGNSYFGILGGEPFMHPQLLDILAAHPDCYFQIFTNGQLITDRDRAGAAPARQRDAARQHRRLGDRQR